MGAGDSVVTVLFKPLEPDATSRHAFVEVADPGVDLIDYRPGDWEPLEVFRTQPSVRKVVEFIAANVASVPLHVYKRASDTDRERILDGPLAGLMKSPSVAREEGPVAFWERFLTDWLLFDRAVAFIDQVNVKLMRIPPSEYKLRVNRFGLVYRVDVADGDGGWEKLDPENFLIMAGYSTSHSSGYSRVRTLESLLREQAEGVEYRSKAMRKALTHTGIVEREEAWPTVEARKNFLESLRRFDASGKDAGKTMLLDEGMKWRDRALPAGKTDEAVLQARQLTDAEACSLFRIQPEILGVRPGTFANMEAFRQALYRDNLGPYITKWEETLAPLVDVFGEPGVYVEAKLESKLRGSFEEQARIMQSATGAPWLTRNEARAMQNKPAIEGGDELVVPLNVLIGGQASPRDSAPPPRSTPRVDGMKESDRPGLKSRDWEHEGYQEAFQAQLKRFFDRQERSIMSSLNAKADWWDEERWNKELADDLFGLALEITREIGQGQARALGFSPDDYDVERTVNFLKTVARNRADWVNATTKRKLDAALQEAEDASDAVAGVYEEARNARTLSAGNALVAALAGWTATEVVRQNVGSGGSKTWLTNSGNPRPSHAAMDGETVGVNQAFSNGMQWPGDPAGGVDQVAGCCCGVEVQVGDY